MAYTTGDNNFGVAKWIVDATAGHGTHTTIAAALTAASSGDTIFLRPGTYTENPTLKAGVNLTAFIGDDDTPTVTIIGKCTMTTAGTSTISGIRLQTNSDFLLAVTGSAASVVNLDSCTLNITNNTGISYTSSSSSSSIRMTDCLGGIATTGITTIVATGAGVVSFVNCFIGNGGASTTPSSTSACALSFFNGLIGFPCSTSGTGSITSDHSSWNTGTNVTCLTTSGTGGAVCQFTEFQSGTASAISIGSGTTVSAFGCTVNTSNTNAITGAGTLNYSDLSFFNSSKINTTTQTIKISSAVQSVNRQVFSSSGTYTATVGLKYADIECQGGGAGGGGSASAAANVYATGGGGGGGAYSRKVASAATIGTSQVVTIGAAGTAGTAGNNAGGNGGTTSVGSICTAPGGTGGAGNPGTNGSIALGGAGGIAGTGDYSVPGQQGSNCFNGQTYPDPQGAGGNSVLGFGGAAPVYSSAGQIAGQIYGGGGSGGFNISAGGNVAGGAGAAGIVIITEYF